MNEMMNLNQGDDLLKRKYLISLLTTIAAVLSVLYALSLPNIYTSKALLAPSSSNNSTSNMGAYSSLAGLAGISLPGGESGNPIIEAMARIKSFDFFVNYFVPNIKIENLVAVDSWLREDNIMIYKSNIFDNSNDCGSVKFIIFQKVPFVISVFPKN